MWQKPRKVRPMVIAILSSLYKRLQDVTLTVDMMVVNGLLFFVTLFCGIKLFLTKFLLSCTIS